MRNLIAKAVWVWLGFLLLAALNGLLRETLYVPQWGERWGRVAGVGILVLAMVIVIYVFLRRQGPALTRARLVVVGLVWVGLSAFLEFAVLRWVMEASWDLILGPYDVMAGRLRGLVRLTELLGPTVLGGRVIAGVERRQAKDAALVTAADSAPAPASPAEAPQPSAAEPERTP